MEDSPPRGHLQNSGLHAVPREPTATQTSTNNGDFGRLTEVLRSQAFPIRERGARSFFLITTELPKGLGRESFKTPISREYHSRRVFARKKDGRNSRQLGAMGTSIHMHGFLSYYIGLTDR